MSDRTKQSYALLSAFRNAADALSYRQIIQRMNGIGKLEYGWADTANHAVPLLRLLETAEEDGLLAVVGVSHWRITRKGIENREYVHDRFIKSRSPEFA